MSMTLQYLPVHQKSLEVRETLHHPLQVHVLAITAFASFRHVERALQCTGFWFACY